MISATIVIIIIFLLIMLILLFLLSLSFVFSSILFVHVFIFLFARIFFFFMPEVKDQQSHALHLVLVYFTSVTNIFRLIVFKFSDFVALH